MGPPGDRGGGGIDTLRMHHRFYLSSNLSWRLSDLAHVDVSLEKLTNIFVYIDWTVDVKRRAPACDHMHF